MTCITGITGIHLNFKRIWATCTHTLASDCTEAPFVIYFFPIHFEYTCTSLEIYIVADLSSILVMWYISPCRRVSIHVSLAFESRRFLYFYFLATQKAGWRFAVFFLHRSSAIFPPFYRSSVSTSMMGEASTAHMLDRHSGRQNFGSKKNGRQPTKRPT